MIFEERHWIEAVPCLLTFFLETLLVASVSPQRALVTFFVKRDKLELTFWLLCSMHAVIRVPMEWWAAIPVLAIPSQPAQYLLSSEALAICRAVPREHLCLK
jgi:hypothetical protein